MVTKININIQGINEAMNFLSKFPGQLRTETRNQLNQTGDKGVKIYQKYAHVQTGRMKKSIRKTKVNDRELEITSEAPYSGHENRKGGDHAFFTKGTEEFKKTIQQDMTAMAKRVVGKRGGGFTG